ncbi:MAG: ABC transporter ATP-binding protein [bacterium]|nr:ABC transporter ATP-binding protein [bacterium]
MIEIQQLEKYYETTGERVHALKNTNLSINQGENVVIVGKSGSGKSTLLNMISGIDRPSSGSITVNGQNLNDLKENELALWRGSNIGIVFQFYQLLPTLSALDNVLFAMSLVNKIPTKERKAKATRHLEEVGLGDKISKFPNELSGGERQRVAIARAIANDPAIIIADEPTGNLDSKTGEQINNLFDKLNAEGTTILTVTHAHIDHVHYDKVIHIEDGILNEMMQPQTEAAL